MELKVFETCRTLPEFMWFVKCSRLNNANSVSPKETFFLKFQILIAHFISLPWSYQKVGKGFCKNLSRFFPVKWTFPKSKTYTREYT